MNRGAQAKAPEQFILREKKKKKNVRAEIGQSCGVASAQLGALRGGRVLSRGKPREAIANLSVLSIDCKRAISSRFIAGSVDETVDGIRARALSNSASALCLAPQQLC
jgi:hypothetical protein